jgi:hypothetical protein
MENENMTAKNVLDLQYVNMENINLDVEIVAE